MLYLHLFKYSQEHGGSLYFYRLIAAMYLLFYELNSFYEQLSRFNLFLTFNLSV